MSPSSGSTNNLRKKPASKLVTCLHAGNLLVVLFKREDGGDMFLRNFVFFCRLFVDSEDGGDMFLGNVGWISRDYTALYPRR
jgi:hypothetical protein